MFERLQFADALEKVVLVVAWGFGGCESFSVYHVDNTDDLPNLGPFDHINVTPVDGQKWTSLLLPIPIRQLYKSLHGRGRPPWRMKMVLSPGDVGATWCREPDQE
jgi:hypothetical protein